MEKKKNFESPKAIVIEIDNEDIILTSGPGGAPGLGYDDFEHGGGNN